MSVFTFILCLLALFYVLGPLQYLAIHRQSPPQTRRIPPADAPAAVATAISGWRVAFGEGDAALVAVEEIRLGQAGMQDSASPVGHVLHFVDRAAAVHGLDYVTPMGRWQVFLSRFPGGDEVVTTNYARTLTNAPHPRVHVARMPGVRDLARLRALHGVHVGHAMGGRAGDAVLTDDDLSDFPARHEQRTLERQQEVGAMARNARGIYRPTLRGAFLSMWRFMPPLNVITGLREARLAQSLRNALQQRPPA